MSAAPHSTRQAGLALFIAFSAVLVPAAVLAPVWMSYAGVWLAAHVVTAVGLPPWTIAVGGFAGLAAGMTVLFAFGRLAFDP